MSIDNKTVAKIAKLAHIEMTEAEKAQMSEKLSAIMKWIEQLNEVDTNNVPPLASVSDTTLPWRKDEVTDGHKRDAIIANAPASEYGCFLVPKVISDE
jgi:aspartyl-tRNA(Asn)/glutamyl-tRNA(Gln) amidotransferase subunit C